MLKLQVIYGNDAGKSMSFRNSVVRIGSDPGNDFILRDEDAAGRHGEFYPKSEAEGYAYRDLLSPCGTRIQSGTLNVLLQSDSTPQSVILPDDVMMTVGHSVIRCLHTVSRTSAPSSVHALGTDSAELTAVFDGFIRAMLAVMDAREPATAGHSLRVARYVMLLAQAIDCSTEPAFRNVSFSFSQTEELRFAALLHDIGKVVIRREILLKSRKLTDDALNRVMTRIDLFRAWFATQSHETLGDAYVSPGQFDEYADMIRRLVQPDVKPTPGEMAALERMTRTYVTTCMHIPLLSRDEFESLLIPFGTLSHAERGEMQKHALISWQHLSQIAWPKRWANVPIYVLQHHEKLNGTGYPYGISGDQILLQSRMLTVCDIFDALTGGDRSYKTRHSFEDACLILRSEAEAGALSEDIVNIFIEKVLPQLNNSPA